MNHEERVKSMAIKFVNALPKGKDLSRIKWEDALVLARLSVQREAESFAEGFNAVYDFTNDPEFGPLIIEGQIERGLIPPQTQTTI